MLILGVSVLLRCLTPSLASLQHCFPICQAENGSAYLLSLALGTPTRTLELLLDTSNEGLRIYLDPSVVGSGSTNSSQILSSPESAAAAPYNSSSARYCSATGTCDAPLRQHGVAPADQNNTSEIYDCGNLTSDPAAAAFLAYEDLEESTIFKGRKCEVRAEGSELLHLQSKEVVPVPVKFSYGPIQCGNATAASNSPADKAPGLRSVKQGRGAIQGMVSFFGRACRTPSFASTLLGATNTSTLIFDLSVSETPSSVCLSDLSLDEASKRIAWSEAKQRGIPQVDGRPTFSTYDWSLCSESVPLAFNQSSHWEASIDFNTQCLSLPGQYYSAVLAWLGITANETRECQVTGASPPCFPSIERLPRPLPALAFHLRQGGAIGDDAANALKIPLETLVQESSHSLCLQRSAGDDASASSAFPFILIGRQVLSSMKIYAHLADGRIGFESVHQTTFSDAACAKRAACRGQQVYYPPLNTCLAPPCNLWMLKTRNEKTETCEFRTSFIMTVLAAVPALGLVELGLELFYRGVVDLAKSRRS